MGTDTVFLADPDVQSVGHTASGVDRYLAFPPDPQCPRPCDVSCPKCGSENVKGHWRPQLRGISDGRGNADTPEQITVTCLFCDYDWTVAPVTPEPNGFAPNGEG